MRISAVPPKKRGPPCRQARDAEALQSAFVRELKGPTTAQPPQPERQTGNAYKKWTAEEDADIEARHKRGESVKAIAEALGRQTGAVQTRLVKLGLILK